MKLTCNQKALAQYLSLVSNAVPSRPTHPILANILVQADKETNQVNLTAFDLSLGISTTFNAEVQEGGTITVPAKLITEIVSRLENSEIHLELDSSSRIITITAISGKYQLSGMGADDFPELPHFTSAEIVEVPVGNLLEGIQGCLFAASTDELKQILTGVHITLEKDTLEFGSTDGHRLAVVKTVTQETANKLEITVPGKTLRELKKMLQNTCELLRAIHIKLWDSEIKFEWVNEKGDSFQLTSRTLHGQYPTYQKLIPQSFNRQITLGKKQFLSVLERIQVFADRKSALVKISVDNKQQEISLSCSAEDIGLGKESMPGRISGDDIDIAFNIGYLMEGLRALPGDEILMQINQPLTPVVFNPTNGFDMTYLAMPIQLR